MANSLALIAPKLVLLAGAHGIRATAPAPTLSATAPAPARATIVLLAPPPSLTAGGTPGEILSLALRAPTARLSAAGTSGKFIRAVLAAPAPRLSAAGKSGNILRASLLAPAPTLIVVGRPAVVLTTALVAPAPRLSASMSAPVAAAYRTWVLNMRKGALTEYNTFPFNSFAQFNGQTLACGPAGLVILGDQDVDGAAKITARWRTGKESFQSSMHKRVPRIYTSGEFTGDMLFRTITEGGTRTYAMPYNNLDLLQQRRVPVGKGPRSRFWQFEGENVNGADFSVNDVMVYPITLRRRVQ